MNIERMAFIIMVCPTLEYASSVWDPHAQNSSCSKEMVQRQGARWVTSNYDWNSSVTSMVEDLQFPTLSHQHNYDFKTKIVL